MLQLRDYGFEPRNHRQQDLVFRQKYIHRIYTEHCSVGPTKLIETIASTRMTVYADEKVYGFLNLDF